MKFKGNIFVYGARKLEKPKFAVDIRQTG